MKDSIYEQIANSGDIEKAIEECQNDITSLESSTNYQEHAEALHGMASILKFYKSEYQKALEYLELEVQVRLLHNLPNIDSTYLKSAILNSYLDKNELVVKYANLALKHANDGKIRGTALNILGDVLFKTKPGEADKYYLEGERLFLAEKDEYNLSHVRLSIARLEGFKLDLNTGLNICQEELNKGIELKNPGIIGTAYLRFVEIYSFNNELKKTGKC